MLSLLQYKIKGRCDMDLRYNMYYHMHLLGNSCIFLCTYFLKKRINKKNFKIIYADVNVNKRILLY